MRIMLHRYLAALTIGFVFSCEPDDDEDDCTPGTEGCACIEDSMCVNGLDCVSSAKDYDEFVEGAPNVCAAPMPTVVDPGGSGTDSGSSDGQ